MKQVMKRTVSALGRFWHRSRIAIVVFLLLVIGVVFAGLHDTGIILGMLAGMVVMIELSRSWRRIRNFIILLFASVLGIILLSFIDDGVVRPFVNLLGGPGAENSTGFEIFNQIVSLVILFLGPTGMITGLFGTIALSIWRLIEYIERRRTAGST